eukprot:CAMPEP_0175052096 /NCGR_PEP_ID=MMETSP0052_2-20121109/8170_1 /TAXON_ID=51329 ORGANISM="Polytomella parva, Strain SAG 63-3" /NCGR_SAMPLE_ID=MMETSP0052_2 /ASSEMBLY_ACC=CAM_ASM_000194 /LENGTH=473 /DNA_ID=CAMNT_0016316463 /DNA_START=23 /DNA_END=1441 /DNA_ORIENTATION=+
MSGEASNNALVSPCFAYGVDYQVKNPMWFISNDRLLWSVGALCATYNVFTKEMQFLPLTGAQLRRAKVLCVSNNSKYLACVEVIDTNSDSRVKDTSKPIDNGTASFSHLPTSATGANTTNANGTTASSNLAPEAASSSAAADRNAPVFPASGNQVGIYNISTQKRVKVLPILDECANHPIENLSFSESSKLLAVLYGDPDWMLTVWRWYSSKLVATIKIAQPLQSIVFNPSEELLLAAAGPFVITALQVDLDDGAVRSIATVLPPPALGHPTACCWLVANTFAVVTDSSRVIVMHEGTVKYSHQCDPEGNDILLAVAPRGRGFVCAGQKGNVYFYLPTTGEMKRAGNSDLLYLARQFSVPANSPSGWAHGPILALALSPDDQILIALTLGSDGSIEVDNLEDGGVGGSVGDLNGGGAFAIKGSFRSAQDVDDDNSLDPFGVGSMGNNGSRMVNSSSNLNNNNLNNNNNNNNNN